MIFGTELKIYNSKNDLVDLNDVDTTLAVKPEGFGAAFENNIFNIGSNFKSSGKELKTSILKLNIYFGLGEDKSEMSEYRKFVEFLNYPPYKLVYTTESGEFYRDCILNEITKTDLNENHVLLEQVSFDLLTPYYKEIISTYKASDNTEGIGKIYSGNSSKRNLVINPNFNNNFSDWSIVGGGNTSTQMLTPVSDKPKSNILKLTSSNNKKAAIQNSYFFYVRENERLSLRIDVKTENNQDYSRPAVSILIGNTSKDFSYSDLGLSNIDKAFKSCLVSFVAQTSGKLSLILLNQNISTLNEMTTYFREPMIIRGDVSDFPDDFYEGAKNSGYYTYPTINSSDSNGKSGIFKIENKSVYVNNERNSPIEIVINGPCKNPYWEVIEGSRILQSDGYNIDIPQGYKLVVSSMVQSQRAKLIDDSGTESNVFAQQDLSHSNFITIPKGRTTLAFHNVGDVEFKYREEYITV